MNSAKETVLEKIRLLPESASWKEIADAILEARTIAEALRRYDEGHFDDEITEEEWRARITRSLAEEMSDPREDIYTLEDGVPSHESR